MGTNSSYQPLPTQEANDDSASAVLLSTTAPYSPTHAEEESSAALNWLLGAADADARQVLKKVALQRPQLFQNLFSGGGGKEVQSRAASPRASLSARGEVTGHGSGTAVTHGLHPAATEKWDTGSRSASGVRHRQTTAITHGSIYQFASSIYYSYEGEGEIVLDVLRVGPLDFPGEVGYETRNGTAVAGTNFVASTGIVAFAPGEVRKTISIPLLENENWDTTLEFQTMLVEDKLVGGSLDKHMAKCRIKIIDDDCFPTNRYAEQIRSKDLANIPKISLFWEFFKMNWSNAEIRGRARSLLLKAQVPNIFFAAQVFTSRYILDYVLNLEAPAEDLFIIQDRKLLLDVVAACIVLGYAILHLLDYTSRTFGAGGAARRHLQSALLFKFLGYTASSRSDVGHTRLILSITRDAHELVSKGFVSFIELTEAFGAFAVTILYQICAPLLLGKRVQWIVVYISICYLPLILTFLMLRSKRTSEYLEREHSMRESIVSHVEQTVANFDLVSDYGKRAMVTERFQKHIMEFNQAHREANMVLENNHQLPGWLTTIGVTTYIFYFGRKVILGEMTVGQFASDIQLFMKIGGAATVIFQLFLDMLGTVPELDRIVNQINLPVDLPERLELSRHRREVSNATLKGLQGSKSVPAIDLMPINMTAVLFGYHNHPDEKHFFSFSCEQGQLVAIVGKRGENKSTLLKILGGMNLPTIEPDKSTFCIPCHLRCLHVSSEPMFFGGTLYDNLTFGLNPDDEDGDRERVLAICERLTLPGKVMQHLLSDTVLDWHNMLSQTEKHLLRLARCFVANYEFVCIHKPAVVFNQSLANIVLTLMKEYVEKRGIALDDASKMHRRPRTCIYTASKVGNIQVADKVVFVDKAQGVREVSKNDIEDDMLH